MEQAQILESIDKKLTAMLGLVSLSLFAKSDATTAKPEVLLKSFGLEVGQIAQILSKNKDAVIKTIQRNK
jgi:hypothetical protein